MLIWDNFYLALKVKLFKGRRYEPCNSKDVKIELEEEAKADGSMEWRNKFQFLSLLT